jgi:hypothetical protein
LAPPIECPPLRTGPRPKLAHRLAIERCLLQAPARVWATSHDRHSTTASC